VALKYLQAVATQGSADAFVEAEFQTGLSNVTRQAYRVRSIEWLLNQSLIGADCYIQAVLRRNSASAIGFTNPNAILGLFNRAVELTTSGMITQDLWPNITLYPRDMDLLIVEESLYLDLDSNGTSLSNIIICRIGVELRNITENERLAIQAASAA